jgi:hypothetical protein
VGKLDIVLSSKAGQIEGIARNAKEEFAVGGRAVLVPNSNRHRPELFMTSYAAAGGRFSFSNIPPGDYKLYVWEDIQFNAWFDLDVLKQDEAKATAIHVTESFRETLNVHVIPGSAQ